MDFEQLNSGLAPTYTYYVFNLEHNVRDYSSQHSRYWWERLVETLCKLEPKSWI